MNKYSIYPTLLDSYSWMIAAEDDADYIQRRIEFLAKVNREQQEPSFAASRGTALNNIIDEILQQSEPTFVVGSHSKGKTYETNCGGFLFRFDSALVEQVVDMVEDAVAQPLLTADIDTAFGCVNLYGYADYIIGGEVIDLKTTTEYYVGKYRSNWQHLVYPYCMVKGGAVEYFDKFAYIAAQVSTNREGITCGTLYREEYTPSLQECETNIRQFLDTQLLPFLEYNSELITNEKIMKHA